MILRQLRSSQTQVSTKCWELHCLPLESRAVLSLVGHNHFNGSFLNKSNNLYSSPRVGVGYAAMGGSCIDPVRMQ